MGAYKEQDVLMHSGGSSRWRHGAYGDHKKTKQLKPMRDILTITLQRTGTGKTRTSPQGVKMLTALLNLSLSLQE